MRNGASGDAARPPWYEDAHRYLAAIVESSDDAIFGKTLDGIIASWNRAAERIYGFTAAEAIGQPVSILVPPEVEDEVPAILERLRRGERIDHYETVRMTKDGRRLNIALTISPIRDDQGRIVGASTIARDVTAQVQARLQLDESRWELEELNAELEQTIEELERQRNAAEAEAERMRRLHRVTAALTGSLEPRHVLETIIDEVIDAFGAYAGSVVELSADGRELITVQTRGYDLERLRPYMHMSMDRDVPVRDAALSGEPVFIGSVAELRRRYPGVTPFRDGDGAWAALPLRSRGRTLGVLALTFANRREFSEADHTFAMMLASQCAQALDRAQLYAAERQARHEAQEASHAKSNFLAVMSHELRTPLTAILGYGALLEDEIVGPLNEQQQEQVRRMRESGRHLLGLIDQILSLSRIEAGRERVDARGVDAAKLLRDVATMVRPLASREGLGLELELPDAPVVMHSDGGKIRQILLNLASNAIKSTERGGVHLRLRDGGETIEFRVTDTGPGIPLEDRERIFHPFEQLEQGMTRAKGGTGLGLSVSLELARLLGGDIALESELGRGSTFILCLPRELQVDGG